jgi:hypothetical protein
VEGRNFIVVPIALKRCSSFHYVKIFFSSKGSKNYWLRIGERDAGKDLSNTE